MNPIGIYVGVGAALLFVVYLLPTNPLFASKRNKKQFERLDLRKRIGHQIDKWDKDETKSIAKDEAIILVKILMEQFQIEKGELR